MDSNQWNEQNGMPPRGAVNGYSIAALVLGICSVVLSCCCNYLAVVLGALAIGFALLYRNGNRMHNGKSMTGFILGIVGLAFAIFAIIALRVLVPTTEELEAFLREYAKLLEGATYLK